VIAFPVPSTIFRSLSLQGNLFAVEWVSPPIRDNCISLIPCVVSFLTPAKEALEWVCGNLPVPSMLVSVSGLKCLLCRVLCRCSRNLLWASCCKSRFFNQNTHAVGISDLAWHLVAGTLPLLRFEDSGLIKNPLPISHLGWEHYQSAHSNL